MSPNVDYFIFLFIYLFCNQSFNPKDSHKTYYKWQDEKRIFHSNSVQLYNVPLNWQDICYLE